MSKLEQPAGKDDQQAIEVNDSFLSGTNSQRAYTFFGHTQRTKEDNAEREGCQTGSEDQPAKDHFHKVNEGKAKTLSNELNYQVAQGESLLDR